MTMLAKTLTRLFFFSVCLTKEKSQFSKVLSSFFFGQIRNRFVLKRWDVRRFSSRFFFLYNYASSAR